MEGRGHRRAQAADDAIGWTGPRALTSSPRAQNEPDLMTVSLSG
jgi:hypothetical protein